MPRSRKRADEALLAALAFGATMDQAAHAAGLSRRTVQRRLTDPDFQRRLRDLRAETVQRTGGLLTAAALEAVKTLVTLQDASAPAGVRLGAARAVLELGMKIREHTEMSERVAALEARVSLADSASPERQGGRP